MDRNYKAFISYRHLPFDLKIAKKLHQTIEHYVVPKDYRKNGDKKIGIVFRDKDELPITSNLTNNLTMALDHSEYLIVICSKETTKSVWVLEEVDYFLKTHDRDHVMVFLIDGIMEESVPDQLMNLYDDQGNVLEHIEPLAANIVADTEKKSMKLFKVEVLRILATLIGCPFDALYRREQRYKMRRLGIASAVVASIALGFIGMLWNRNVEIQKQLNQALIKDSEANAALSDVYYDQGAYSDALRCALAGLPENVQPPYERPYVPKAEAALSNKIPLYFCNYYRYESSLKLPTRMNSFLLSPDGSRLAVVDSDYTLFMWDTVKHKLLWQNYYESPLMGLQYDQEGKRILFCSLSKNQCLDVETGEEIWSKEDCGYVLRKGQRASDYWITHEKNVVKCISAKDGSVLYSHEMNEYKAVYSMEMNAMAISQDGSHVAFTINIYTDKTEPESGMNYTNYKVYDWDLKKDTMSLVMEKDKVGLCYLSYVYMPDNSLFTLEEEIKDDLQAKIYTRKKDGFKQTKTITLKRDNYNISRTQKDGMDLEFFYIDYLATESQYIYVGSRKHFYIYDTTDDVLTHINLPDYIAAAHALKDGKVALICDNGIFSLVSKDGLSQKNNDYYFDCEYTVNVATIAGDTYENVTVVEQPLASREQLSIIRWTGEDHVSEKLKSGWTKKASHVLSYVTPDGKTVALLNYDIDKKAFVGTLIDEKKNEKDFEIPLPEVDQNAPTVSSFDNINTVLVDSRYMIHNNILLDFEEMKAEYISSDTYAKVACALDKQNNRTLTALESIKDQKYGIYVIENMKKLGFYSYEPTEETEQVPSKMAPLSIGGNGYIICYGNVVDENNESTYAFYTYDINEEKWEKFSLNATYDYYGVHYDIIKDMGEKEPYFAYVNSDYDITIANLKDDQANVLISEAAGKDIVKLLFVNDDRNLVAFHGSGFVKIYDTKTGEEVSDYMAKSKVNLFTKYGIYRSYICEEQKRMIIIDDENHLTNSFALVFDLDSMECVGRFNGICHYYEEDNQLLSNIYKKGSMLYPFYTFDEIRQRGREILGEEE